MHTNYDSVNACLNRVPYGCFETPQCGSGTHSGGEAVPGCGGTIREKPLTGDKSASADMQTATVCFSRHTGTHRAAVGEHVADLRRDTIHHQSLIHFRDVTPHHQ